MAGWFTPEAIAAWRPAKTGLRGRPQEYSDLAMETTGFIREVFHLSLRQTEGFITSIARVMDADISIPDYSCISKRSIGLSPQLLSKALKPGSLVIVDSTGLKAYGKDEWHHRLINRIAVIGSAKKLGVKQPPYRACVVNPLASGLWFPVIPHLSPRGRIC